MTNRREQKRKVKGKSMLRTKRAGLWAVVLQAALLCAAGCGGSDKSEGPKTRKVKRSGDADFRSIQACISASSNRDTCLVYPGTYSETIDFKGKAITVRSSAGPEETIIDAQEEGPVVTFDSGEEDDSVLEGFTITNGLAVSGEETIEHGGGIRMISAGPTIRDCILLENRAEGDGGGIYCFSTGSNPDIENVIFQGNTSGGQGGALCGVYGGPDLVNCLFFDNEAGDVGGAISTRYWATLNLTGCTFADNSAPQGWALYLKHASVKITESILWNNSSSADSIVMDLDEDPVDDPALPVGTTLSLSSLCLQGGTESIQPTETCSNSPGLCTIDEAQGILDPPGGPLFVPLSLEQPLERPWEAFYLSEPETLRSGQVQEGRSPCVDAGDRTAEEAGLEEDTTRTDGVADEGNVDLGYHYAAPTS